MSVRPYAEDLGPFWVGDTPDGVVQVDFLDDAGQLTQRPADTITATLTGPAGVAGTGVLTVTVDLDVESVDLTWTTPPTFDLAGIWTITLRPEAGTRYAPLRFVVQDDDGWTSIDDARTDWADAPTNDATLFRILEAARTACLAWAPDLEPAAPVPTGYRLAQLMQARAQWNATKAGPSDSFGADGMTVTVFPLDWNVKALLRPKRARPVIR